MNQKPKLHWHPYDAEAECALPIHERKAFGKLLSATIDEMPECAPKIVVSLALGTTNIAGQTLASLAARAKLSENALLRQAAKFCEDAGVMASPHLRQAWHERQARQLGEALRG